MKSWKETFLEMSEAVQFAVIICATLTVFAVYGLIAQAISRPIIYETQRNAIEQSKSFIDGQNSAITDHRLEHGRLAIDAAESKQPAVYNAQMTALKNSACEHAEEIPNNLTQANEAWINENC